MPASSLILSRSSPSQVFLLWEHCTPTLSVWEHLWSSSSCSILLDLSWLSNKHAKKPPDCPFWSEIPFLIEIQNSCPFNAISDQNSSLQHRWAELHFLRVLFMELILPWDHDSLHHDLVAMVVQDNLTDIC